MYCDSHIHLLPDFDNGPQTVEESLRMLEILKAQKTRRAILTPHYDPDHESIASFLARRQTAEEKLVRAASLSHFCYLLSAEVAVVPGIAHDPKLEKLLIPRTRFLPISLPVGRLDTPIIRELAHMLHKRNIKPIVCETERHFLFYSKEDYARLISLPYTTFLFSAPAMADSKIFREVLRLHVQGCEVIVGSNAHDASVRPPETEELLRAISLHHGERLYHAIYLKTNAVFNDAFSAHH